MTMGFGQVKKYHLMAERERGPMLESVRVWVTQVA